jgi:hypothetical protein
MPDEKVPHSSKSADAASADDVDCWELEYIDGRDTDDLLLKLYARVAALEKEISSRRSKKVLSGFAICGCALRTNN